MKEEIPGRVPAMDGGEPARQKEGTNRVKHRNMEENANGKQQDGTNRKVFQPGRCPAERGGADLLCRVLGNAEACDGFVSETYASCRRDRRHGNVIDGMGCCRYRIVFDGPNRMHIAVSYKFLGDDGHVEDAHWDWANARTTGHDIRKVLSCLRVISWELP